MNSIQQFEPVDTSRINIRQAAMCGLAAAKGTRAQSDGLRVAHPP